MKKLFLLILSAFSTLHGQSQFIENYEGFKVEWSEIVKFGGNVKGFFDVDRSNFSVVVNRMPFNFSGNLGAKIRVKSFQNFRLQNSGKILLQGDEEKVNLLGIIDLQNKAIAFSSQRDFWQRSHTNYYHEFNHYNIGESIDGQKISTYIYPYGYNFTGQIDFTSSEDFTQGAAYFTIPSRANEYISMGYVKFKQDKKTIEEHIHLLPYKQYEIKIKGHYLSNEGEYFLITEQFFQVNPLKDWSVHNRNADRIKILHATEDSFHELALNQESFVIKSLLLDHDDDGNLIGSGFYADMVNGNVRGTFFLSYDVENDSLLTLKKNPLSKEMISNESLYYSPSRLFSNRTKLGRSLNNFNQFNINLFQQTNDGGYITVAEQVEVEFKSTANENNETPANKFDEYYFHNDLIIFKMNRIGEIQWVQRVPKYQESKNDGGYFLSATEYLTQESIHLFFNDHRKNYDEQGEFIALGRLRPTTLSKRNNVIAGVTISLEDGKMTRKRLEGRKEHSTVMVPKLSRIQQDEKEILIYGTQGRKHRFGKISFFND
jgi:hypothetical protein